MGSIAEDALARAVALAAKPKQRTAAPAREVGKTNAWPEEIEKRLIALYNKGYSNVEIAPRVGRTPNAVGIKINRLRNAGKLGDRGNDKR